MFNLTSLIGLNDDCYRTAFSASSVMAENSNFFIGGPFNMSASRSIDIVPKGNETIGGNNTQEFQSISCTPSRASYDVRITYIGGIRSITRSYKYLSSIRDMMVEVEQYSPVRPNCGNRAECFELSPQDPAEWNWPLLQTLTAFNHFALIDALITPLSGNYTMTYWGTFMSGASSPFTCGEYPGNDCIMIA
jgi:hypothetical protein